VAVKFTNKSLWHCGNHRVNRGGARREPSPQVSIYKFSQPHYGSCTPVGLPNTGVAEDGRGSRSPRQSFIDLAANADLYIAKSLPDAGHQKHSFY
jgi:hypothetical protein